MKKETFIEPGMAECKTVPLTQTGEVLLLDAMPPMSRGLLRRLLGVFVAGCLLTACSSDNGEEPSVLNNKAEVTLTFSPYEMTTITRSAVSIVDVVTHLDVWIYESGTEVTSIHQTTADATFGTVTTTLDKTKTYTLYAVGHRASGAATLADGVISFPDDKVTHSMFYQTTFSPGTSASLSCLMQRIVAQFSFKTTDELPADVMKMRFTIGSVFDRWNVTTGGVHEVDRVSTFSSISTNQDGTVTFNVYAITTDAQTLHTVTVEALDADGNALVPAQQKVFENVPLRNGYKTTYRGAFFTEENMTMTFTVNDWNEYETVDF